MARAQLFAGLVARAGEVTATRLSFLQEINQGRCNATPLRFAFARTLCDY